MSLTQEKFYYKFGIRKPIQLLEPQVLSLDTILLPMYSVIHMLNVDDGYYPSRKQPILKNVSDAIIYNRLNYEPVLHKATELAMKERNLVSGINKSHLDFTTYTRSRFNHILSTKRAKLKNTVPLFTYKYIHKYYRYPESLLSKIYKFENKYSTIVNDIINMENTFKAMEIKDDSFKQYLIVETPKILYDYNIITRYLDKDKDAAYLKLFHNETYMLMLELFKLLNSETSEDSILSGLAKLSHVDIMFKQGSAGVIVNLKTLLSFNKDMGETGMFTNSTLCRSIIKLFNILQTSVGMLEEEVVPLSKEELLKNFKNPDEIVDTTDVISDVNVAMKIAETDNMPIEDTVLVESLEFKNKYDKQATLEDISEAKSIEDVALANLNELNENNKLDKKKLEKLSSIVKDTLNKPSPFKDGTKIKDNLTVDKADIDITEQETRLPDVNVVFNKEELHDPITIKTKKYMKEAFKKDMVSSIMGIQGTGMIVEDIEIIPHDDTLGDYDEYAIKVNDLGKTAGSTVKLMIPRVNDKGVFTISNNEYLLRNQKADAILKKIKFNRVSLSTAYGKLFVDKAPFKKLDRGYSLRKELLKLNEDEIISNLSAGSISVYGEELPKDYTLFGRYVKAFKHKSYYFNFNFDKRKELITTKDLKLETIEHNKKYILCGHASKDLLVMDEDNIIYSYNGKYTKLGTIFDLVPINTTSLKKEYSMVKIFKSYVPVAYLLTYYMGLKNVLKTLKIKYEVLDGNKRVEVDDKTIVVKLDGSTLILYPNNETDSMILNGFNNDIKIMKQMTFDMLNHKDQAMFIFKEMKLNLVSVTEIKALETLFIDPVSRSTLELTDEPTTFVGLLVRAAEMLVDDNYKHPNSFKGFVIKGYDRIPQLVYKTLVSAVKKKISGDSFGRGKMVVDPYDVWRSLNEDSSGVLVDDLNPIADLKQSEDTTLLGAGGRSKESLVGKDRAMHEDDVGIMSESSKDSSDVGITAYLSANPKFANARGTKNEDGKLNWSNVLSTSAMLVPFATADDPKRVLYMNIQNSHLVPIDNAEVYPVRTGYEAVVPYKVGSKYVVAAEDDGVVTRVTKNSVTIQYKKLGKKTYTFKDWTSKEESNSSFMHRMATSLKEKDKLVKDDIVYYDISFFDTDMFNRRRIVYRASTNAMVGLMETSETDEDSLMVSEKLAEASSITHVKIRDLTLDNTESIKGVLDMGIKVTPTDPLFMITTGLNEDGVMSEETLDLLQGFVKSTPKAKYKGKLIKLKVYYNCEPKELSRSLKKLVATSEPYMEGKSGRVSSGYSINGKPLGEGKVHIKFYIEINSGLHVADKGIISAQLKSTVASIYKDPILSDDGTEIDALFSLKGIYARIVNSAYNMGTTASVLKKITDNAVDIYFK